jgi:hypothetical protein
MIGPVGPSPVNGWLFPTEPGPYKSVFFPNSRRRDFTLKKKAEGIFFLRQKQEMLRFILLNRKKTTGVQPPEGGAHTTHNHTTVLAKRLQLGKEPPSTTDHNNIRPRLALPPTKNGEALRQKVNQT